MTLFEAFPYPELKPGQIWWPEHT